MRAGPVVLALALLVGPGCGGDDEGEPGGRRAAPSTAQSTAPTTGDGAAGATPTTTAAATSTTTTTTATTTAARVARPPAPAGRPAEQGPARPSGFAAPGRYRYATTGRFSSTAGGDQPRDGETVLTVDPPAGTDQRSVRQGPGRTTEQVLRVQEGGAFLVSLRQSEQGVTKEVRPSPPALAFPADAAPGRAWSWRAVSTDGQMTVDASFRVARAEEAAVGAERVATLVVDAVVTTSGDVVSTARQTLWVSPAHRLVVRLDESVEGRLGAFSFTRTGSDRLLSLTPF